MIAIICLKDGDANIPLPIMTDDESYDRMAIWPDIESARDFADGNMMCKISTVIFIDLENEEVV